MNVAKMLKNVLCFSFSAARKCSNSGRGLMQLDFTQFLSKIEKISPVPLKHLPDREYVDIYVKAYYLPDNIMEEFIQSHPVSLRELIPLCKVAILQYLSLCGSCRSTIHNS